MLARFSQAMPLTEAVASLSMANILVRLASRRQKGQQEETEEIETSTSAELVLILDAQVLALIPPAASSAVVTAIWSRPFVRAPKNAPPTAAHAPLRKPWRCIQATVRGIATSRDSLCRAAGHPVNRGPHRETLSVLPAISSCAGCARIGTSPIRRSDDETPIVKNAPAKESHARENQTICTDAGSECAFHLPHAHIRKPSRETAAQLAINKSSNMKTSPTRTPIPSTRSWLFVALALCLGLLTQRQAFALSLTVVDGAGAPVSNFRWMLEEDNTAPGLPGQPTNNTVSMIIHKSHAPVVATGSSAGNPANVTIVGAGGPIDPAATGKRYLISVLADGYSTGGADLKAGQLMVRVIVNSNPIPTRADQCSGVQMTTTRSTTTGRERTGYSGCHNMSWLISWEVRFLNGHLRTSTWERPTQTNGWVIS